MVFNVVDSGEGWLIMMESEFESEIVDNGVLVRKSPVCGA
jgi:hypothetical protein